MNKLKITTPTISYNGHTMTDLTATLGSYFGFSSFREGQAESIQSLLSGHNTLAVMPTGSGKSLIFQLAALLLKPNSGLAPVTLVISPLIALMKDQVDSLTQRGISATYINSALPVIEQKKRLGELAGGKYSLIYIAPERLRSTAFLEALRKRSISLLAVDEAHCISEWGHDFRPDYLNVANARTVLGNPLTVALTATATPLVQTDILRLLGLEEGSTRIITGFNRKNLRMNVRYTGGLPTKFRVLKELLSAQQQGAIIVYTGTRRDAEEVALFAREVLGISTRYYHAGLPAEERTNVQEAFISGKVNLVIATNAFGMGIDRADVRQVIHFSLPGSLEAYYQECGRAGRDGLPADATLLYDPQDCALHEFFIKQSLLRISDVENIYRALPQGEEIWSTIDDLSLKTGQHPVQIKVGLSILERSNVLAHLGDEGIRIMYRRGRWNQGQVEVAILHSEQHAQNRQKKLESIVHYSESNECRRKIILQYFGDPDATQITECCDNCQVAHATQYPGDIGQMNHGERAALITLDCLRRVKIKVGRTKLVKILHGSKAQEILKYHHDRNTYYGRLASVKQMDIDRLVEQLIDLGYIKIVCGEFPTLALTPRGENAIKQKEAIVLELPKSFKGENVQRAQAKLKAGGSVEYTAKLLADGLSPQQIADLRALALTTIFGHLAQLISTGKLTVDQVVPLDNRKIIENAILKVGSTQYLTPIKALLPDSIDYNVIRCVVAGQERQTLPDTTGNDADSSEIETFLARDHPRLLAGPWRLGWSLGFHSRFSGSEWSRSTIGELAFRLKYHGDTATLPELIARTLALIESQPDLTKVDFLTPVPSSVERKINAVYVLCETLAKNLKLPVRMCLEKTRITQPQKEITTLAQKRTNVAGAFVVRGDVRHKRILVIDDLFDSGATLEEITHLLLRNGAKFVNVFALTSTIHSDL